jgi:hypothetical protein
MDFDKKREEYRNKSIEFAKMYEETPTEHVLDIMVSVMMTRDKVLMGGSFVQSIVLNQLYEAITRADVECLRYLKLITLTNRLCFI